jgi:endo-1,4-beta-xylanase
VLTRRQTLLFGLSGLVGISVFKAANKFRHHQANEEYSKYSNRKFAVDTSIPLAKRATASGLIYGAAVRQYALSSDTRLAATFARECAILVPEWELKWNILRPHPNKFNFGPADWLASFARSHRILLRGHTLVWHQSFALPKWFSAVNTQNARKVMLEHIETVVKRYAGRMHSWDVVNEAIEPKDGRDDGLRKTPWLQFLGPNYIDLAFRVAAQADPHALLVYNDYGLDYDTSEDEAKRTAVLKLMERLKSRGTPIHALGIQAHLRGEETKWNPKKLRNFLKNVAGLGLKILITELDVVDKKLPRDIKVRDRIIAAVYEDYLSTVLEEKAVIAVITWGLSDRYSWLNEFEPRPDRAPVRPLPLDAQMQRKLAWNAIARAFDNAPKR